VIVMSVAHPLLRVNPDARGKAALTCPICEQLIRVDMSALSELHCPVTVDCNCGHRFSVIVDATKLLRKPTRLMGQYAKFQKLGSAESGFIDVEELSIAGITFQTRTPHTIRIGDLLSIRFAVDKLAKAEISKSMIVRQIQDKRVAGEFCDKDLDDAALAAYLKSN
jgi:hypothetical protein